MLGNPSLRTSFVGAEIYILLFCAFGKSEVSINSRCVINSMDISPTAQYDNIEVFATPCNPLGSLFIKGSK
mgnify:CR=1 FL=1